MFVLPIRSTCAACGTTTVEVTREVPVTPIVEVQAAPAVEVPCEELWASSVHNAAV